MKKLFTVFNWEKNLFWTKKKIAYLIFINKLWWYHPKIMFENIVQKDMNKFLESYLELLAISNWNRPSSMTYWPRLIFVQFLEVFVFWLHFLIFCSLTTLAIKKRQYSYFHHKKRLFQKELFIWQQVFVTWKSLVMTMKT